MTHQNKLADPGTVLGVRLSSAAEQVLVDVARALAGRLDEFDPDIEHPVTLARREATRTIPVKIHVRQKP